MPEPRFVNTVNDLTRGQYLDIDKIFTTFLDLEALQPEAMAMCSYSADAAYIIDQLARHKVYPKVPLWEIVRGSHVLFGHFLSMAVCMCVRGGGRRCDSCLRLHGNVGMCAFPCPCALAPRDYARL